MKTNCGKNTVNLQVSDISKNWSNSGISKLTLRNVSLSVSSNEFVCILGPSGCGKTTLLKIMAGIVPADKGRILFNGRKVSKTCSCRGMVFQEPALFPWKTVAQNVELGLIFHKMEADKRNQIVQEKIRLTGLDGYEEYYPNQLSGGMKQKTQLARILAMNPEVVMLDEPFAAMDEILKHKFDNYLLDIWQREQKTFILVTHSIEEALLLADRIIIMKPDPGEIHLEQRIDLPRPRDLFSKEIVELRKFIRHELSKFY